jgi:PAS domain S-box-containing protein
MTLAVKIAALAVVLVVAAMTAFGFMVHGAIEHAVTKREEDRLVFGVSQVAEQFNTAIEGANNGAQVATTSASVEGLIRAIENGGTDPVDGISSAEWKAQVAHIFTSRLATEADYLDIALIGLADNGLEIVRVVKGERGDARIVQGDLDQRGMLPFFQEAIKQPLGVPYISEMAIEANTRTAEMKNRPVIHVATSVATTGGRRFGIIEITLDCTRLISHLTSFNDQVSKLYMTTRDGDYILGADLTKLLAIQSGRRSRIQDEFPWLASAFQGGIESTQGQSLKSKDYVARTVAVSVGSGASKRTWIMLGITHIDRLLEPFFAFRGRLIAYVLVLIGLSMVAAVLLARHITKPISRLTQAAKQMAKGNGDDVVVQSGEFADANVAKLGSAFETMRDAVKCREQSLRDAHARIQAVVDNAPNPIITIDECGRILHANDATSRMFGYTSAELKGQNVSMLMPTPDREAHDGYLRNYLQTGEAKIIGMGREVVARRRDGSTLPVALGVSEVRLTTGRTFVGMMTDLSENRMIRKLEDALQLEKIKGEFVATVNHELRTPLTSIKGSLALLTAGHFGTLPEKAKSMIEIAYTNSERLAQLINDILDMEKIEGGQMRLAIQKMDVAKLLHEAARCNGAFARQLGVKIKVSGVPEGLTIKADPDRIEQALANLISNALKYSPKGAHITLAAKRVKGSVRILVNDKGPGIPKEFRDRIFSRFAQADSTDTRQKGGSGLGLSITKAIVEAHGGSIGFKTALGKGSTFFLDLPRARSATEPVETSAEEKASILICDAEPGMAQLINLIVEEAGYRAETCQTAAEARERLDTGNFAGMTLDLALPDTDGITLLRELRQSPKYKRLPVIVISVGASGSKESLGGTAFSFVDWLDKPLDPAMLGASIRRLLDAVGEKSMQILHVEDDKDHHIIVADVVGDSAQLDHVIDFEGAIALLKTRNYDLVILGLNLPDRSDEELLPLIASAKSGSAPAVLVYSIKELPAELAAYVDASLVKARTDNEHLKAKIQTLLKASRKRSAQAARAKS